MLVSPSRPSGSSNPPPENEKRTDTSGRELLCDAWTSDGGHLNGAGSVRVASALWWLMARIGGWNPTAGPLQLHTLAPCRIAAPS